MSVSRLVELDVPVDDQEELLEGLRARVPDAARDAVRQIEKEMPAYVRSYDARYAEVLAASVEWAIGHFVALMGEPDLPSEEILEHFRQIGAGEAREGRSLEPLQMAFRIGAGVAVRRLTDEAGTLGGRLTPTTVASVAQGVFTYLDHLVAAAAAGNAEAAARAEGAFRERRRRLLEALITPDLPAERLKALATECGWRLPNRLAAVALGKPSGVRAKPLSLGPDVLLGLHLDDGPCLVVPDPESPGRAHTLERGLRHRPAAIGPAVPLADVPLSLRLARQALALAEQGGVTAPSPITVTAHLPLLILQQDPAASALLVERTLRPLAGARATIRGRLAETFLACIESGFNATEVAARMHVHPQTVRYRVRQLEALFSESLYDPARRLEFHMALRFWLANADTPADDEDSQ